MKFERSWDEIEAKHCFLRQSITKHFKKTLNFMWNGKSLISIFQKIFASADKVFISGEGLTTKQ